MKSIEDWAKEHETPDWLLAAMKASRKWGEGKRVEKSTYEKALNDVGGMKLHAYAPETPDTRVLLTPDSGDADAERGDLMSAPADSALVIDESKQ